MGLPGSGKTNIVYRMVLNEFITTIPTISYNIEQLIYENIEFRFFDTSYGGGLLKPLWRNFFDHTDAIIFVIDGNNKESIHKPDYLGLTVKKEFNWVIEEAELLNKPILIFITKQDLKNTISKTDISKTLQLDSIKNRQIFVQQCSARTGDGVFEGLDWIVEILNE